MRAWQKPPYSSPFQLLRCGRLQPLRNTSSTLPQFPMATEYIYRLRGTTIPVGEANAWEPTRTLWAMPTPWMPATRTISPAITCWNADIPLESAMAPFRQLLTTPTLGAQICTWSRTATLSRRRIFRPQCARRRVCRNASKHCRPSCRQDGGTRLADLHA